MATGRLGMIFMLRTSMSCAQFCKSRPCALLLSCHGLHEADGSPLYLALESTVFTIVS